MTAQLHQASCVGIAGRALLIEGPPGSGKSALALALIDRGAGLIGDDGVSLAADGARLIASPPPRIAGLLEVRNLGLLRFPVSEAAQVALVLRFDSAAPRFIDHAERCTLLGIDLPLVRIWSGPAADPIKAELALATYGAA